MRSYIQARDKVTFPDVRGHRVYMHIFMPYMGLPEELKVWQPTVDAMLYGVDAPLAYLMIDQGFVNQGEMLRRPGLHIDGYWHPGSGHHGHRLSAHGTPREPYGHGHPPSGHDTSGHKNRPRHGHGSWGSDKEAIILASDHLGCMGYIGEYEPNFGEGGDASSVNTGDLWGVPLLAGYVWAANVRSLHESTPALYDQYRTVVRLNVPGWEP